MVDAVAVASAKTSSGFDRDLFYLQLSWLVPALPAYAGPIQRDLPWAFLTSTITAFSVVVVAAAAATFVLKVRRNVLSCGGFKVKRVAA